MDVSTQAKFRSPHIGRWLWLTVALAMSAAGGCQPADTAEPESQAVAAPTVVHAGAQVQDRIDGLDLATGADGSVHLVWRERPGLHGKTNRSARLMYQRGHGDPLRWGAPVQLADGIAGTPRVVAARDGLHVLAGSRLDHWWLPAGADRWQPQPALLGDHVPRATTFDAVGIDGSLFIVYATGGAAGDQVLNTLRWRGGQAGPVMPLVRLPAVRRTRVGSIAQLHDPVLAQRDGRLLLLWGTRIPAETGPNVRLESRVQAAWSTDGGMGWSEPGRVTSDGADDYVNDLAVDIGGVTPLALFVAHGLFASHWDGDAWSPPRRLAGYDIGSLSGSAKAFRVAAASCAGRPLVAWVDGRHQGSDRRWWNPLGGFPWSDSPEWANNDLFVLAGDALAAELDGRSATPRQQTVTGGQVEDVAVVDRGDHALLVWSGRKQVRKSSTDMGTPPTIWHRRIECD